MRVDVALEAGAEAIVTSQAAEKIYRSDGPPARIELRVRLESAARLDWLPQETILFDRRRVARRIDIEMAADAAPHDVGDAGVRTHRARRADPQRVLARPLAYPPGRPSLPRRGGAARRRCGGVAGSRSRRRRRAGFRDACACRARCGAERWTACTRQRLPAPIFACAASAWNGMLVARFAARAPHELNAIAGAATCAVTGVAMPRSWIVEDDLEKACT